jgi:hypothetical protein
MTIQIKIKEPVPHGTDLIGIKENLAYVLEQHDLAVGMIDIRDSDQVENRYKHLRKAYGEQSEYVAGFRDCMRIVERSEK